MFDLFMRYCRMVDCVKTMRLTPQQCKDNDLTVSECTFIYDHFDDLKKEYGKLYYVSKGLKKKVPFEYLKVLNILYPGNDFVSEEELGMTVDEWTDIFDKDNWKQTYVVKFIDIEDNDGHSDTVLEYLFEGDKSSKMPSEYILDSVVDYVEVHDDYIFIYVK